MKRNDIVITLEGGLVQGVSVSDPELLRRLGEAVILDYDTEGAEDGDTTLITQSDGGKEEAYVNRVEIGLLAVSSDDGAI